MKLKLKHSLYIMIVVCSIVPIAIWTFFNMHDTMRRTETLIKNNIAALGGSQAMSIYNFCEGRKESMQTISRMELVSTSILMYNSHGQNEELDNFLKNNEEQKTYIGSISVVDKDFNVIGSSQSYEAGEKSELQYTSDKFMTGAFIMGNAYDRETDSGKKRMVPAYIGIYHEGELIGYLIEEIDCDYFDRLRLQTDFLEDGTLYILDGSNNIVTAGGASSSDNRDELISSPEEREDYLNAWNSIDHDKVSEGVIEYSFGKNKYMTYFADIEYTDWSLRITENISAQMQTNQSVYLVVIVEAVVFALLLIGIQFVLTKKLATPFETIVKTMKNVQEKHDYTIRTKIKGQDEVAIIAQGIDELLDYIEQEELEEKRIQRQLEHKEFLSAAMLANMPSGYHRCSPDAEKGFPFLQLGSHIEEILGWSAEEIKNDLGNCYRNLIWPEDLEIATTYAKMVSQIGKGNAYDTSVYRMKHKDGGYRWITDATMFVDLGPESFFQGVIADITPYVEGLEEAKRMAEESSHAKTDFLSQMSHDIRTPMNAIIGFTNLAKDAESIEQIKEEYIPKIDTASNHLLMIINDVLEMNSIEKGKIIFRREPSDICVLVDDIATVIQLQTEKKELKLTVDKKVKDRYVYCDRNRFNRVLMNLASNAVKFTPPGGEVHISVEQLGEVREGFVRYQFKVADTGIGMSPEFAPKVFDPFERERTSTVSRVEGTGLGMAIVKSIIDAASGTISVESKLNEGTTFTFDMLMSLVEPELQEEMEKTKQEEANQEMSALELMEYFEGKRVLLVEDNEFNRAIAEVILENAGFMVETAEDGHVAVQRIREMPREDYYDVVLMDIQMPTMNGYEATRAIRQMSGPRSKVKIVALTANAFESDRQLAAEAGMNEHLPKPIDVDLLYRTLKKIL